MNQLTKAAKTLAAKYNSTSLILRIAIGLVVGSVLALICPGAAWIEEFGNLFVGALKGVAPVLVFVIVASALAQGSSKLDRRFGTVVWLYMLTTFVAAALSVVTSKLYPQTLVLAEAATADVVPQGLGDVMHTLLSNIVSNPVASIMNGNYIGILMWACLFGLAMKKLGSDTTKNFMAGLMIQNLSRELFAAVQKALDQAAQQAKDREIHSWSPNLLKGKIFCAHCGRSLHRQKCVRRKSQEVYVYHCISNNRIKKGVCPGAFIFEKELLDTLADMIQEQLDTTLGQYSLGLENLSKEAEEQKNIQAKIASRKQKIQQLRTYQRGLYEGLIQNHLSKDEYFTFKEKYEAKIEAISKEIEQLKAGLAILAKQLEQYKMLSQDAQHIKEDRQLTAALIDRLIDRVEVSREKRITVRFRFQSEFEHCEEVLSQCRNM